MESESAPVTGNGDPTAGGARTPVAAAPSGSPEELVERVQGLMAELELIEDRHLRERTEALVGAVIELYGEGLERIFAIVEGGGERAAELRERLAADGVVASLMLIHGLYPVPLAERVAEALESVRPYMESHGGNVELLGIESGIARIRLEGSCEGCPASSSTLELAIKGALDEAAPDLEGLVVEGAPASPAPLGPGAAELPVVGVAPGVADRPPAWFDLDGPGTVAEGRFAAARVNGVGLIVARVEGSLLAFHDRCAACAGTLADGALADGVLTCAACSRRYFLPRAGRSLDDERLLLEPVPLLVGAQGARVALAA